MRITPALPQRPFFLFSFFHFHVKVVIKGSNESGRRAILSLLWTISADCTGRCSTLWGLVTHFTPHNTGQHRQAELQALGVGGGRATAQEGQSCYRERELREELDRWGGPSLLIKLMEARKPA